MTSLQKNMKLLSISVFILSYNYHIRVITIKFLTLLKKTQKQVLITWEDLPEKKSFLLGNAQLAWRWVGVEGCGLGSLSKLILTLFSKWTSCQNCVQVLCSAQKKGFFGIPSLSFEEI